MDTSQKSTIPMMVTDVAGMDQVAAILASAGILSLFPRNATGPLQVKTTKTARATLYPRREAYTHMIGYEEQKQMVATAAAQFPETFGLRAFPGDVFRVSKSYSYVNDSGVVQLYTEVQRGDKWLSFAKGTVTELRREIV